MDIACEVKRGCCYECNKPTKNTKDVWEYHGYHQFRIYVCKDCYDKVDRSIEALPRDAVLVDSKETVQSVMDDIVDRKKTIKYLEGRNEQDEERLKNPEKYFLKRR